MRLLAFLLFNATNMTKNMTTQCVPKTCAVGCTEMTPGFGGPCKTGVCESFGCRCLFCQHVHLSIPKREKKE